MSETNQIQVTAENAEEFLNAALEEEQAAKGNQPEAEEEAPAPDSEETKAEAKPNEEKSLEIGQKEEDDAKAEAGDATDSLSMEDVFAEYAENGELSSETNEALVDRLTKAGFDNAQGVIDQYIAGAQATVASVRQTAFSAAGGEEQYGAMIEWAKENFSPKQIAAYDAAVSDPDMIEIAVNGLRAQFEASTGSVKPTQQSQRVNAGPKPDGDVDGSVRVPRSNVQVSDLVSDPRYARDPGHRASVDAAIQKAIERGLI